MSSPADSEPKLKPSGLLIAAIGFVIAQVTVLGHILWGTILGSGGDAQAQREL